MGDPQGALMITKNAIKKDDGTCMIVEPFAQNELENNLNPVGRTFYAASTLICVSKLPSF